MVPTKILTISDPKIIAIPVQDNNEPLVDLSHEPDFLVDRRKEGTSSNYCMARQHVANMLAIVQRSLASAKLLIIEGYRPPSLQKAYFDEYYNELKAKYPDWSHEKLYQEASTYVAPPENVPPHSTGGAIDLTLADKDGHELDMGVRVNASPEESDRRCYTMAENISDEAKANRKLLNEAMNKAGFVNFPCEFWHWSYGDKYWAYHTHHPHSIYGSV